MTRDDIIELALQCGIWIPIARGPERALTIHKLCRLATLVAAAERTAMAYHRCAQFKKENDELRAKIEAMERQEPLITVLREPDYWSNGHFHKGTKPYISLKQLSKLKIGDNLYALPGAKGE